MSRKTGASASLSNGTLSLRFMQRGATQRVSTTAAKVADEAEWDIGPAARAALGVTSGIKTDAASQSPSIHVIRDDSYIPFMFDRDTSGSTSQQSASLGSESDTVEPGRRRIFRQGTEVAFQVSAKADKKTSEEPEDKHEQVSESDKNTTGLLKSTKAQQLRSISGPSAKPITGPDPPHPNVSGVRRHRLEGLLRPPGGSSLGFVKPTGVASATGSGVKRTRENDSSFQDRG